MLNESHDKFWCINIRIERYKIMPMYPLYDVCNAKHNTDKNSIINLLEKNKMNFKYIDIILKLECFTRF